MTFNHQEYIARYVNNIQTGGQPLNDAAAYGAHIVPADNVAYDIEAELNRRLEIGVAFPRPDLA